MAQLDVAPNFVSILPDSVVQFTATARDSNGQQISGARIAWRSSDPLVATVSSSGLLNAVGSGSALVIAEAFGAVDTGSVFVYAPAAAFELVFLPADSLFTGDSSIVGVLVRDVNGMLWSPRFPVTWNLVDTGLVTTAPEGNALRVRARRPGTARFKVSSEGLRDSLRVRVLARVASATIAPKPVALVIGDSVDLTATLYDSAGAVLVGRPVAWSALGTGAAVSASGSVKTAAAGFAQVIATAEGRADTAAFRIGFDSIPMTIVAASRTSCVVTARETVYCWGHGGAGQLGIGRLTLQKPTAVRGASAAPPLRTLTGFVGATCGLTAAGEAWCWGSDVLGSLGPQPGVALCGTDPCRATPAPAGDTLRFTELGIGTTACGLASGGSVWCWGSNVYGQFGNGGASPPVANPTPVRAAGNLTLAHLAVGLAHVCGLDATGVAWCWGADERLQLGRGGPASDPTVPQPVSGSTTFVSMASGMRESCAITAASVLYCWGNGVASPTPLPGAPPMRLVALGVSSGCGLSVDSLAYCWGENSFGQLGNGTVGASSTTAVAVFGGRRYRVIAVGDVHACAIGVDDRVYCWGRGTDGELGRLPMLDSAVPGLVAGQP